MNTSKCLFCNSEKIKHSSYLDTVFNKKTFTYKECKTCELIFVQPLPTIDDYVAMYPVTYQGEIETINKNRYEKNLNIVQKYSKGKKMLDYGCGQGGFLLEANDLGFECVGTEFSADLVASMNQKLPFAKFQTIDSFLTNENNIEKFDIILLNNVLEHLTNPHEIMAKLHQKLAPNGIFMLIGPIENNFSFSLLFRKFYFYIQKNIFKKYAQDAPTHIFYATAKNQQHFLDLVGLKEVYFEIGETAWPFPDRLSDAKTQLQKIMYFVAKISLKLQKKFPKWGNHFIYVGENKTKNH